MNKSKEEIKETRRTNTESNPFGKGATSGSEYDANGFVIYMTFSKKKSLD